ncbi:hypothetical protein ACQUZK_10115, partial [Streptococcus pyogenes]|uniref:hypothetical protein n=1 Tax=Streptococcus pyogenes TaxID=1314 RepID=UPI003DA04651
YEPVEGRRVAQLYPVGGLAPAGCGELRRTDDHRADPAAGSPDATAPTASATPGALTPAATASPGTARLTVSVVLPLYDGEA